MPLVTECEFGPELPEQVGPEGRIFWVADRMYISEAGKWVEVDPRPYTLHGPIHRSITSAPDYFVTHVVKEEARLSTHLAIFLAGLLLGALAGGVVVYEYIWRLL